MGIFEILGGKFVSCNLLTSMGTFEILGDIVVSLTGTFETLGDWVVSLIGTMTLGDMALSMSLMSSSEISLTLGL